MTRIPAMRGTVEPMPEPHRPSLTRGLYAALLLCLVLSACVKARPHAQEEYQEPPTNPERWRPTPGTSWQWQLVDNRNLDTSFDVDAYNIDLFDLPDRLMRQLKEDGRMVICYFSAGTLEEWRADAHLFPAEVVGEPLVDWPREHYLDVSRIDLLSPIMLARLDLAQERGCDAVEPDNVDTWTHVGRSGFTITGAQQLAYNRFLAEAAHERGLAIALKNDLRQIPELLDWFDFAINEQCHRFRECYRLRPFIQAGKAVLGVEYVEDGTTTQSFCPAANAENFDFLLKNRRLDAERIACR